MNKNLKQVAFSFDSQICTGCKTCMVACKDKNDLGTGMRWRRVVEFCGGQWMKRPDDTFQQNVFSYYLSISCNHCIDPICVESCPTGAMNQAEDGIVSVDPTRCMGCRYCEWGCPYSAPQFNVNLGQMTKCDFCRDELNAGNLPACVASCPTRALTLVESDESCLTTKGHQSMAPLPEDSLTLPTTIIQPHKAGKPTGSTAGLITNPEENKDA